MTIQTLKRSQLDHKYNMSYYYEKSVINVYFCFLIRSLGINTYNCYLNYSIKICFGKENKIDKENHKNHPSTA